MIAKIRKHLSYTLFMYQRNMIDAAPPKEMASIDVTSLTMEPGHVEYGEVFYKFNKHQLSHITRHVYLQTTDNAVVRSLPYRPLNRKRRDHALGRCNSLVAMSLVHAYYNQDCQPNLLQNIRMMGQGLIDKEHTKYVEYISQLINDAIGPGYIKLFKNEYRSSTVMNMLRHIRENESFTDFPIFADAMEDAGFAHEELLNHWRTGKFFSLGSWIFRTAGLL